MPMTPLEIHKMKFQQKMRGYDPQEVENFLETVADELTDLLARTGRLESENARIREKLAEADKREAQLQEMILRAQKVSDEITNTAKREAQLTIKEAEVTGDQMVQQSLEQAARIEAKISELRTHRRELQLKFKNTLDLFQHILEAEMEDDRTTATVRTLQRKKRGA